MASQISPVITNVSLAAEPSYRGAVTITEADWHMLNAPAVLVESYLDAGVRGIDPRSASDLPNTRMSGRQGQMNLSMWLRGSEDLGARAPREMDNILRASGCRYIPTSRPKTWIYEPWHNDARSLAVIASANGQNMGLEGSYVSSWTLDATDAGIARISAMLTGVLSTRTQGPGPSLDSVPTNIMPVKFDGKGVPKNSVIKQGAVNFNPIVKSMSLSFSREITTRRSGNQDNALAGFALGRYGSPTLTMMVEATDLGSFNPHLVRASALPCFLTQSFVTGNTWWYIVSEQARLVGLQYEEVGGILYWSLTFNLLNRGLAQSPFWIWCAEINSTD